MGRPRKRFCSRGHDTDAVGRYANRSCRECARDYPRKPKPKLPRCRNGHDLRVTGVGSAGCRLCAYLSKMPLYFRKLPSGKTFVPASRLKAYTTRDRAIAAWQAYRSMPLRNAERAVDRLYSMKALELAAADRWCVALGTHLSLIYPELYATYEDEEEAA